MRNFILLGPPGSGKSTQAELLVKNFGLAHIDVGAALREAAREDSFIGKEIDRLINVEKTLVPDPMIIHALEGVLDRLPGDQGVIVDGAPRRSSQIDEVEGSLAHFGRGLDAVIFIRIDRETAVRRIAARFRCSDCQASLILGRDIASPEDACPICGGRVCQRQDDTPEGVGKRFDIFMSETLPVIEHYRATGRLLEVEGGLPVEEIATAITDEIDRRAAIE